MLARNVLQYDYALHNQAILPLSIAAGARANGAHAGV